MNTPKSKSRILVVDDIPAWMDNFEKLLKAYGEERAIEKIDKPTFLARYDNVRAFTNVDYCFIDLELGLKRNAGRADKAGLTEVLPRIRQYAPWIPTACISVWIGNDPEILRELSVSDFDGFYPKSIIVDAGDGKGSMQFRTGENFNPEYWKSILRDISLRRLASMTGQSVIDVTERVIQAQQLKLSPSKSISDALGVYAIQTVKEGIAALGLGATEIALTDIVTGFSGIFVAKAEAFGSDEGGQIHSRWLIKWGAPVYKLAEEAAAHRKMFCRGLDRTLQVPQLFFNPVVWGGLGFTAYGFEEDSLTALEAIEKDGIGIMEKPIEKIGTALYHGAQHRPANLTDVMVKWIGKRSLPDDVETREDFKNPMVVSRAMIHGDLHLRNILLRKGVPTLIDFARSNYGPVAIDAAKTACDALIFACSHEIVPGILSWQLLAKSSLAPITSGFARFLSAKDDFRLFNAAIEGYARQYLMYPDVPANVKDKLAGILGSK